MGGQKEQKSSQEEKKEGSTQENPDDKNQNSSKPEGNSRYVTISTEEAQRILDKQYENHYKVQEGLFRLTRVLIAIITVAITAISTLFSQAVRNFIAVPSFEENMERTISGMNSTITIDVLPEMTFHFTIPEWYNIVVFVLSIVLFAFISVASAFLGVILLSALTYNLLNAFSAPVLKPVHDTSEIERVTKYADVEEEMSKSYKEWIKFNRPQIKRSNWALNIVYRRLLHTIALFAITVLYALLTYFTAFREGLTVTAALVFFFTTYRITAPKMDAIDVDVLSLFTFGKREGEHLSSKEKISLTTVFVICLLVLLYTAIV